MPGLEIELGIPITVPSTIVANFDYTTPSPLALLSVHEDQKVISAIVHIDTAFDDVAATVSVGHTGTPNAIFPSTDVMTYEIGSYRGYPDIEYFGADTIRLFITPGTSTQGSGSVAITIYNKE